MTATGFKSRRTKILVALIGLSFLALIFMTLYAEGKIPPNPGNNSYSRSSLGHELLCETLRELDFTVRVNRDSPVKKDYSKDLFVFAEPIASNLPDEQELKKILRNAGAVLLILPKRSGFAKRDDPNKVKRTTMSSDASMVLKAFVPEAAYLVAPTNHSGESGDLAGERTWIRNTQMSEIEVDRCAFVGGDDLEGLISTDMGSFLASLKDSTKKLYIASDPDIFATHGMVRGNNTEIAVQIFRDLLPPGGDIIFDEVSHGFQTNDSFWQLMFRYPLNLLTLHLILLCAILFWVLSGRLGQEKELPAALERGKRPLLDNVVGLMSYYNHHVYFGAKYLSNTIKRTAAKMQIKGTQEEVEERLGVISSEKEIYWDPDKWRRDLASAKKKPKKKIQTVTAVSKAVHQWQKEMNDGS